ncbi:MAG: guanylate kinase [Lachnospiraceae bacterium]|nr:guanylate kinase [Lachnospiraceae bacterium]
MFSKKEQSMLTFGIDWDDVIAPFNDRAIEMANEEYHFDPPLTLEDITSWENTGRASVIRKYYHDPRLYDRQYVPEESKEFIRKLQTKGIVYIVTAAYPQFMTRRMEQIREAFPDFPEENIIMGFQKSVVHVDITLDDGPQNILKSNARFPVLMRKPWNTELTGLLAVNNFEEFFTLLDQIKSSMIEDRVEAEPPAVIALVGPSGSNKNKITRELCRRDAFTVPRAYTTKPVTDGIHTQISPEEFIRDRASFIETTMYAGYAYGTKTADISALMAQNRYIVMPIDLSGAIAMKRHYPTIIIFCKCSRERMIGSILEKEMTNREKTLRLMSLENELKNAALCDYVVNTGREDAVQRILEICGAETI